MNLQALENAGLEVSASLGAVEVVLPRRARLLPLGTATLLLSIALGLASELDDGVFGLLLFVSGMTGAPAGLLLMTLGFAESTAESFPMVRRLTGRTVVVTGNVLRFRRRQIPLEEIEGVRIQKTIDLARLQVRHGWFWVTVARGLEGSAMDALRRLIDDARRQRRDALREQGVDLHKAAGVPGALEALRKR